MFFSSRTVSIILALSMAILTLIAIEFFYPLNTTQATVIFVVHFAVGFVLTYIILEFLIFKEINNIYSMLEKIKRKDLKMTWRSFQGKLNPLQRLNQEIFSLATKKQQEIDELKRLEAYRREFLADVSHELKTPIFAAQGFVHTLLDGAINDKSVREKFLRKAARSLDGLQRLVEDLLTLSQMETGQVKMNLLPEDLIELVKEQIDQLEEMAKKRHTELRVELKGERPMIVNVDKPRIERVFRNLMENAIKYGNEGGKVTISLVQEKEYIQATVKDDGPGIPSEHLSRIFERFYRIEKSRAKGDEGGTGLGLAIVKYICEGHNSRVSVTSKPGKGAAFSFRLDRYKPKEEKASSKPVLLQFVS
jgi:two-component system phosphate regulon sensor histidine kinase PhoR